MWKVINPGLQSRMWSANTAIPTGKEIVAEYIRTSNYQINTNHIANGVYFLVIEFDSKRILKKIVIEK